MLMLSANKPHQDPAQRVRVGRQFSTTAAKWPQRHVQIARWAALACWGAASLAQRVWYANAGA
jgi:hypothetical protein